MVHREIKVLVFSKNSKSLRKRRGKEFYTRGVLCHFGDSLEYSVVHYLDKNIYFI